jgi:hypothetical protein
MGDEVRPVLSVGRADGSVTILKSLAPDGVGENEQRAVRLVDVVFDLGFAPGDPDRLKIRRVGGD